MSSDVAVNLSVSGREASVYAYGSGTHTITVTSPYGTDEFAVQAGRTVSRTLSGFSVPPPVADFLAMPTEGWDEYYTGEFVSLSTGWITDYLWEFGDGQTSTELAASHKYALPGVYTVTLRVSGPGGSDAMTKRDYIVVKDFDDYPYPDYIVSEPVQEAFDAALDAIEASQSPGLAPGDPVWCTEKPPSNWCSMVQHGGGGRILFGFRDATIDVNWDDRIDARNPSGNSDHKRDWFGDNLIIDGQDKNIRFRYNGRENCGQHESGAALRIHGNDNIVRNITWDRFPDGLHMRGGMRNLVEGCTVSVVCEDAMSFNGSGNACVECIARNNTYGNSRDKTFMYSTAQGSGGGAPARAVITGMHSTDGNQPIRMTGGSDKSMLVVRNSTFIGESQGPRLGGEKAIVIFENNYSSVSKSGGGAVRLGDEVRALIRNNTLENSASFGIWIHGTGARARVENNIIRNNGEGGVWVDGPSNMDLGGGLVDLYENGMVRGPGTVPVPSAGGNVITGNAPYDVINVTDGIEVKAELNIWDHDSVGSVEALDVEGPVDVDPIGVDLGG